MKEETTRFVKELREEIIEAFTSLESEGSFERKAWTHKTGGGGEMAVLRGRDFEKAAVNFSAVSGPNFPMKDGSGPFFATGVSLITHMRNPHVPTVHMNIRYIETDKTFWFGGGYDLTPMGFPYPEDTKHFHSVAKKALEPYGLYEEFSNWAKEYFYIKHWERERGEGGIFFDHQKSREMWKDVGSTFLDAIMPIYKKRLNTSYDEKDRLIQLKRRAQYAEFNLVYDRGTKFGFSSGGNPEAILCSMPPLASW